MKILFFIYSLSCGGAERATANLANYWAERDWDVGIVTLAAETQDFYALHPKVRRIALRLTQESPNPVWGAINNMRRVMAFRKVLREERPDVAVGMMTSASVLLALAGLRMNRIVRIGCEQNHPPMYPLGLYWEHLRKFAYPCLDAVVALTNESAQWIANNTGARCIRVIPNPLVWPLPSQPPKLDPHEYLEPGQRVLLSVGKLTEQKGFDLLIAVFAELAPRFPEWVLVILGEGPLRKQLEVQVLATGLQGRVLLPGVAGNVQDWYKRADAYVLSSRFEGFGNVLSEALAEGLPAVSFDCPAGPRNIIRHGIDGMLLPAGDLGELKRTLRQLMSDETLRRRLGERAVEVRERFSVERVAMIWEELFARLIK